MATQVPTGFGTTEAVGLRLFTQYLLQFEITGLLMLAAVDRRGRAGQAQDRVTRMVPTTYYIGLSAILFSIGIVGVLVRRNAIVIFLSIELMLNAANLAFVAFARQLGSIDGQVIVFFVMTVAAAEAAVGLAIIIAVFRHRADDQRRRAAAVALVRSADCSS